MRPSRSTRRRFLADSGKVAVGAAGVSLVHSVKGKTLGANERIRAGVMGIKGRGRALARGFAYRPDVEVAYLCDVDNRFFSAPSKDVEDRQGKPPKLIGDFRRILDDPNIDVLINATPDHWHAIPTIMACQAGKDVYVEKPASHNIREGRMMVEAARKYDRVVQLGTQSRSAAYAKAGIEYLRSGKLGSVHLVRVFNMKHRTRIDPQPDGEPPKGVDYDMWLGPAPMRAFNPNHFHYTWHWFWDYSGGDIINDGIHQMDLARWIIDRDYPRSAVAFGGKHFYHDDAQETPDTQIVSYEYDRLTMTFELTLYTPYMKKIPGEIRNTDTLPDWPFCATRIEVYGSKGLMMFGRHGGGWQVFGPDTKPIETAYGRPPSAEHFENFVQCIRSRTRPNADIEEGHRSTLLCHMGNISYRLGGRKLTLDAKTETFVGDAEADALVRRTYRSPWDIREV